ncbi:MAG: PAS domain S-box protein, partial [Spirochaetaceae bacterium]|nr:PAS domain S-box protein [Spirochaetaceae bacterium]
MVAKSRDQDDDPEALSSVDVRKLLSELQVHQIELDMQNEELRKSQAELETSRSRYFDLFDLAPIGYLNLDRPGKIVEANLTSAGMLGVTRDRLIDKPFEAFLLAADQSQYRRHHLRLFETGEKQSLELQIARSGGAAFWASLEMVLGGNEGDERFARLVMQDIDSKKRIEIEHAAFVTEREQIFKERDLQMMEQLVQADKLAALGVLVASVAHEINNPNHAIMLNAGFVDRVWKSLVPLLERYFAESGESLVGCIEYSEIRSLMPASIAALSDASAEIDRIVIGLKEFAVPDQESFVLGVNLNAVARASASLVSGFLKKATIHFSCELDPWLPTIRGSFHRLEQVIVNLLQNACQALTDQSQRIMLTTSYDPVAKLVSVVVSDEGRGMGTE